MAEVKRKRRTNAEILADNIAKKKTQKRVRRTKEQIAKDNAAKEAKKLEQEAQKAAANLPFSRTVRFLEDGMWAFGYPRKAGETVTITEGTREYGLSFDRDGKFVYGKSAQEQIAQHGRVKYEIVE